VLTTRYKPVFNRWLEPLAVRMARRGVTPGTITLITPALTLLLCLFFIRTQAIVPFCLAMLLIGTLDGLDGAVARASGRVTKVGAYLDAMCDRVVEVITAVAVAAVTGYWGWITLLLSGSLLVSYAKARAAMEIPISNLEWPDLMERTERGVVFLLGLALRAVIPRRPFGHDLFWWTLIPLTLLTYATVVQRVLRARRLIAQRSRAPAPRI